MPTYIELNACYSSGSLFNEYTGGLLYKQGNESIDYAAYIFNSSFNLNNNKQKASPDPQGQLNSSLQQIGVL